MRSPRCRFFTIFYLGLLLVSHRWSAYLDGQNLVVSAPSEQKNYIFNSIETKKIGPFRALYINFRENSHRINTQNNAIVHMINISKDILTFVDSIKYQNIEE